MPDTGGTQTPPLGAGIYQIRSSSMEYVHRLLHMKKKLGKIYCVKDVFLTGKWY